MTEGKAQALGAQVKVTVGVCVKNAEPSIKEALESVIDQDFPHKLIELIVVDGCSKDRTVSIAKDYLSKIDIKNRFFFENEGLGKARQIVVNEARGDYIVWVDGDMTLARDFVRKQVEFMEANPQIGIAKGRYESSPGPNLLATLEIYSRAASKLVDYGKKVGGWKSLGTSGCIYRVRAIRQVGGFDSDIRGYGEDWDAEFRTSTAGWLLSTTQVKYRDYERLGLTWKELWQRYWRRGYNLHDVLQKHEGVIRLYRMLPPAAFLLGLFNSVAMYKLAHQKAAFLLPFQHMFKMFAWWIGFITAALEDSFIQL